jgi:hypothetical protein
VTTRKQRERLIRMDRVDDVFTDEACRKIWTRVFPRRAGPMPRDFPRALRVCLRAYLETADIPSRGEINKAVAVLYRGLLQAIEADDRDAAATALEKLSEAVRAELHRLTPGGIPIPMQIRDPQHGIERAKELLGCLPRRRRDRARPQAPG